MTEKLVVRAGITSGRRSYSAAIPGPAPASAAFSSATFRTARKRLDHPALEAGLRGLQP